MKPTDHQYNMPNISEDVVATAAMNIHDILTLAVMHTSQEAAVVISDLESPLAVTLTQAYRRALPTETFIDFNSVSHADIFAVFATMALSYLVVLIQSTSFHLKDFRVRVERFERSLKVIEHPHLARMRGEEASIYVESLAYAPTYFRIVGHTLKKPIEYAKSAVIGSSGEQLVFGSAFQPEKLNVGDYTGMKNIVGQFPNIARLC